MYCNICYTLYMLYTKHRLWLTNTKYSHSTLFDPLRLLLIIIKMTLGS